MVDRSTAAAREESGHLDENVYLESLEWEPAVPEDNQRAFRDLKHREPSVVSRIFGLLTTGHLRQRDKSAHSVPLMYGMQGRSSTSERLILGKSRCWKGSVCLRAGKSLFTMIVVALTIVGLLHLTESIIGGTPLLFGLSLTQGPPLDLGDHGYLREIVETHPAEITRDVMPLPCHSHNDYWRRIPLYEALYYGCASVEADIWLTDDSEEPELHVGHSLSSLKPERTLHSLYTNPLLGLLDAMNPSNATATSPLNGVFQTDPTHSLVFLIDIKNNPHATFAALQTHLQPLRAKGFLTTHNGTALNPGPLTIVTTGLTPYASIVSQNASNRDIFFDAPLAELDKEGSHNDYNDYNTTTSLYASASLSRTLGSLFPFSLFPGQPSKSQLDRIRSAVDAAHARGLKVRWWETPAWPRGRRGRVWKILMQEGADVLNVDDLKAARGWNGW